MAKQKFNHAFTVGFTVESEIAEGHLVPQKEVIAGLAQRLTNLLNNPREILEACESYDTYECNPACELCERPIRNMDNAHEYKSGYVC